MTNEKAIHIYPNGNKHRLFLVVLGIFLLAINLMLISSFWQSAKLLLIFTSLAAFVVFISGITKWLEPAFSFTLTPKNLTYHHRCGDYQLLWRDIKHISELEMTVGVERQSLPYIAISLHSLDAIVDTISPRLANKLIHEQKSLLIWCVQRYLVEMEDITMKFEPFKLQDRVITGPIAEFLHHCTTLHQALGYHLVIPTTALDRDTMAFSQLLKQCQISAKQYND